MATEAAGGTIRSHFKSDNLSDYENAVKNYIQLIVLESCPFAIISSTLNRRFYNWKSEVSKQTVQETIINLVELVEQRVDKQIKSTKAELLFDCSLKLGRHYFAIMVSYMQEVLVKKREIVKTEEIHRLSFSAPSPMEKVPESGDDGRKEGVASEVGDADAAIPAGKEAKDLQEYEADNLNAETQINFLKGNLSYLGCHLDEWVVSLISDNCSKNRNILRKIEATCRLF